MKEIPDLRDNGQLRTLWASLFCQCSICNRHWISAQVKILCHMYWEPRKLQGLVLMRIFAQRCQKCSKSKFENPEFSAESIQRILEKLVSYIVQKYYGHGLKKIPSTSNERVHLDGPHDRANCEACILDPHRGCAYKAKPLKSPSPPPQSHSSSSPQSHGSFPLQSHSSSPPQSHGSSSTKSHSSSPPQSPNFLSQPASTYSENMHVQEHREPNVTGLFTALSLFFFLLSLICRIFLE